MKDFLKGHKKLVIFISIFLVIFIGLGAYVLSVGKGNINSGIKKSFIGKLYNSFSSTMNFQVIGGNFDLNYKKLPFSEDHIDFIFNYDLDKSSINKENINITPKIKGDFSIINSNTVRFTFSSKLKVGSNIEFTFSKNIKTLAGIFLKKEVNFLIEIVSNVKVVKIIPNGYIVDSKNIISDKVKLYDKNKLNITSKGELDNLTQNFAVLFNMPIVPLTDLDSRDKLPCPILFEPDIKGVCKWTTTSVLEFIPDKPLNGATDYKVKVINKKGMLYSLLEEKEILLKTPNLKERLGYNFSVNDGIKLGFNFPVDLDTLKSKIHLFQGEKELKIKVTKDKLSESNFVIKLSGNTLNYRTKYLLKIDLGLKSKYGNRKSKYNIIKEISSYDFLKENQIFRNIYSKTGSLIDVNRVYYTSYIEKNKSFNSHDGILPIKDLFFTLNFEEEVPLNKTYFSFKNDSGKNIKFKISYKKEEKINEKTKEKILIENKKVIKLELQEQLLNSNIYTLQISKDINNKLKTDIQRFYKTSKPLVIKDFFNISYSKSCLYLSNSIENVWTKSDQILETIPKTKIFGILTYDYIPYNTIVDKNLTKNQKRSELRKKGYCADAEFGEHLYVLNTRLNPNTKYELKIKQGIEDIAGNILKKGLSKKIITGNIKNKDKYLYLGVSKTINVIPDNKGIIVNLQSINLDSAKVNICEFDEFGYMEYTRRKWEIGFIPDCKKSINKNVKLKNYNWKLSNNKFDIEKDILGNKFSEKFISISGYNYGVNLAFKNTFIKESLSLILEKAGNKNLLFITDYSGNIIKDVNLNFYKYDKNTKNIIKSNVKFILNVKTGVFENNKKDEFNFNKKYDFDFIVAKSIKGDKKYFGFLDTGTDIFSNYDFKYISGVSSSEKDYLYLYTERPIYKPGDKVYFKGLLRKFTLEGYKQSDIKNAKIELIDSNFKAISTINLKVDKNSNISGEFILPKNISLGKFAFRFTDLGIKKSIVRNNAYFYIEEYRKPTFKVNIDEGKKDFILGNKLDLLVKPEYYFGSKMINTTGKYKILTQNYFFDAKDYSSYQFGNGTGYFDCIYWGYCEAGDNLNGSGDFKINNKGEYKYNFKFSNKLKYAEKIYNFSFDVVDPDTSRVVSKTTSKILHTTDAYVGINSNYYNNKDYGVNISGIVLNFDAKELKNKKVKIELIKKDWKTVKKKGIDGVFYNEYSLEEKLEKTFITKSDNSGKIFKNIKSNKSGEYKIKLIYTGSNGKSFVSSKDIYVAGKEYVVWANDNNDITEFVGEKVQVKVGETAKYMLKTPINTGKALIIIEKDDGILDYFIHDIKSYSDQINIKVKDTYYPNYYLRAFLIGKEKNNPLPIYKRALIVTKVDTKYKKLNVEIKTKKEKYMPGEKVNIDIFVKDANGKPIKNANGSISIVDESLLALKGNPKKNPYAFFYDMKRYLGTNMYSSLKNLIDKLEIKDTSNGEKGGAGDKIKGGNSKKKRGNFKDTAFWQADFMTDKNGKTTLLSDKLPDNLTTWVIETIINTKQDNKIGINYKTIITSKSLILNDNLPRFLGSNDTVILSPVVFNKTGKDSYFNVSINATNIKINGDKTKKVFIASGDSKTVNFNILVNDIGISKNKDYYTSIITFKVEDEKKKFVDEIEKIVKIKESSTPEFVSTFGKTNTSSTEEILELGKIKHNAGNLIINYSATLLVSVLDGIKYLNSYPYGCAEQITSAIMPNIFIKKLYNSVGNEFDLTKKMVKYWVSDVKGYGEKSIDEIIKEYLVNIRKFQKNDGGFVYWYDIGGNNYSNFGLTSYVLESNANIRSIGYKLEEQIYFNAIAYLKYRFYTNKIEGCNISKYNDCKYSKLDRMKSLSAISSFDDSDYEVYKMYKLLNIDANNSSLMLEKAKLIGKIIHIKGLSKKEKDLLEKEAKNIIDKIISQELVFNSKGAYLGKTIYYSRLNNTALLLEIIGNIGLDKFKDIEKIIDNMNRWIISQKKNGSFGSTTDNINVIKSITSYLQGSGELKDINYYAKLKLNTQLIEEKKFNSNNKFKNYTKEISLDQLKDKNSFVVEKEGKGSLYYDLNLSYYKNALDIPMRDEGFFIEKAYYNYNEYKHIESIKNKEIQKYNLGEIEYKDMKYPKNTFKYLKSKTTGNVGELLIVKNRLIITETRDQILFEGYIPAGSELVNPNISTSGKNNIESNVLFDRDEYRTDKYFGYKAIIYPGIYDFTYLIRLTHAGEYSIRPSRASEFYNVEVFGRTKGEKFIIK